MLNNLTFFLSLGFCEPRLFLYLCMKQNKSTNMTKAEIIKSILKSASDDYHVKKFSKRVSEMIKMKIDKEDKAKEFSDIMHISIDKANDMLSGNYHFSMTELLDIEHKLKLNFLMI